MPSKIDLCDALFKAFNQYPTQYATMETNFKHIGHTSMSIGDFVTFTDDSTQVETLFMCASCGWKEIGEFKVFGERRDAVIEKIFDMPIDILMSMYDNLMKQDFFWVNYI